MRLAVFLCFLLIGETSSSATESCKRLTDGGRHCQLSLPDGGWAITQTEPDGGGDLTYIEVAVRPARDPATLIRRLLYAGAIMKVLSPQSRPEQRGKLMEQLMVDANLGRYRPISFGRFWWHARLSGLFFVVVAERQR